MKLKKARSTAAVLAVMALTAGFSSVYAAGPLEINVNGELDQGEKVFSTGYVQSEDIAEALEGEDLSLGRLDVTGKDSLLYVQNQNGEFRVNADGVSYISSINQTQTVVNSDGIAIEDAEGDKTTIGAKSIGTQYIKAGRADIIGDDALLYVQNAAGEFRVNNDGLSYVTGAGVYMQVNDGGLSVENAEGTKTVINGDSITTGTVDATDVNVVGGDLYVQTNQEDGTTGAEFHVRQSDGLTYMRNLADGGLSTFNVGDNGATFIKTNAAGEESKTIIDGDIITTGTVKADNFTVTSNGEEINVGDAFAGYQNAGIVAGTVKDGVYNGMAIGHSYVGANQGIAIGDDATINDTSDRSIAFGVGSHVYASNAVALGYGSIADRENAVSVGSIGQERQITNVAAGTERTDAVNKGQLDDALAGVGIDANGGNVIQADKDGNVTIDGNLDVNGGLTVGDTVISGKDLAGVADISGIKTDVATNTSNITALQDKVGSGDIAVKDAKGNTVTNLTDAVNANYTQIQNNSQAINALGNRVSDLGDEIDSVGAISAALAGLHPLDYDGTGSKFQISAAMGTYDGTQAAAIGGFYHFNRDVMLSLGGATSFEGDRKTAANIGVTFRVGAGASGKAVSDDVMARLEAMDRKITALEQENQQLKGVLGAIDMTMSKDFPDVPANHWAYEAVSKLAGNGVVDGYPDGEFHGDRTMTRYEMAEIIYKAMNRGVQVDQKLVDEFRPEMEQVAANQNA